MNKILIALILILAFVSSCEDPFSSNFDNINTVTGLSLFDINGAAVGLWGIPNDNRETAIVYPNPSSGNIQIFSTDTLVRIWIVKANCNKSNNTDISSDAMDLSYEETQLDEASLPNGNFEVENQQNSFNFSDFDKGFFRVFYKSKAGVMGWQNIFIDSELDVFTDPDFLDGEC